MANTRSFVWLFMEKVSTDRVQCKICGQQLGYTSSTSNMRRHIQMKHPEQNDTVTSHVKDSFGGRDALLTEAVQKFMERNSPSEYTCSLCLLVFKDVKDKVHLKQHINCKHPRVLNDLVGNVNTAEVATREPSPVVENNTDQEENMPDSDEDYLPSTRTRFSAKKSRARQSVNAVKRLEQGRVEIEQRRPVQWGFRRKSSSIIWSFMVKVAPKGTMCMLCNKHFNFDGSTSNMHKHVKKVHPEELAVVMGGGSLELPSVSLPLAVINETKKEIITTETSQLDHTLDAVSSHEEVGTASLEENVPFFKKKPTSMIWKFMMRIGMNKTMCRLCKRRFNYFLGSTSNMHKHIKCSHPAELDKVLNGEGPLSYPSHAVPSPVKIRKDKTFFTGPGSAASKFLPSGSGSQQLNCLVNLVVSNLYPSSLVEKESFAKFVHMLNPKFLVPDKEMMEQTITKLYKMQQAMLRKQLDEVSGISLSTEVWTYRERQQYMTVTGHFVSDTWDIQSSILKTVLLDSRSDLSSSIAARLDEILREWNIFDKVKCIVIDNTEHQSAAVARLNKPSLCCMALALNGTVQESLKASNDIGYLATRVRNICNFFVHSYDASEKLKQIQRLQGKTPLMLLHDTEPDWISTYKMFKCYTELHTYLGQAISAESNENMLLVAEELELLGRCVKVIEPFALAAEDLASDNFTTLSKSLPVAEILKQMISSLAQMGQDSQLVGYCSAVSFTRELYERIEKWVSIIGDRNNFLPWAATLLDPRFKHMVVEDPEMQQWVETQLQRLMEPNEGIVENELQAITKTGEDMDANISLLWSSFDETIKKCVREEPVDELQRYVEERPITRQEDPFKWWMEREHLYPKLCKVVKQFLSIPANSVPSSQIFSEAKRRNLSLRNFIEESQLDSFLFLSTCQLISR